MRSSHLRLSLIDERDGAFPFSITRIYALGQNRAQGRAEADGANLRRTVFPHVEIGARHLPLAGTQTVAKRGVVALRKDLVHVRRIGAGRVVGVTPEHEILVLDARTGEVRRRIGAPGRDLTRTLYSGPTDVLYALVLDERGEPALVPVDLSTGRTGAPVDLGGREPTNLAFSAGSGQALVAFGEGLELRSADLGRVYWAVDFGRIARSARGIVPAFGSGGRLVAAGLPDGRLMVLDRQTGRVRYEYPWFQHALWDVMFLHDDQVLVGASEAEVTAYSVISGKLLFTTRTPLRRVRFLPCGDGRRVVVGADGGVWLADLTTGEQRPIARDLDRVSVHDGEVYAVEAGVLQQAVRVSERTWDTGAGETVDTGLHYNLGDEFWVFCDGPFAVHTPNYVVNCHDSFLFDDWTHRTTGYLQPATGEIRVTVSRGGRLRVVAGRTRYEYDDQLRRVYAVRQEKYLAGTQAAAEALPRKPRVLPADLRVEVAAGTGITRDHLNVVLLGDGWLQEDLRPGGPYEQSAHGVISAFEQAFPFRLFLDRTNFFVVYVPSPERGADDRPEYDNRRTTFDASYFGVPDCERALIVQDRRTVMHVLRLVPEFDLVGVLVNDGRHGGTGETGSGGFLFTTAATRHAGQIALHEAGHTLGKLGDEYEDAALGLRYGVGGIGYEPPYANVQAGHSIDFGRLEETLKWGGFCRHPRTRDRVGAHEGAYYVSIGMYRPCALCRMRDAAHPFCPVCAWELYRTLCLQTGRLPELSEYMQALP